MTWLTRIKDKLIMYGTTIVSIIMVVIAAILFIDRNKTKKDLDKAKSDIKDLELKKAKDTVQRQEAVIDKSEQNKKNVNETQNKIDDIINESRKEDLNLPEKGKDFLLSVIILVSFIFVSGCMKKPEVVTEYVYIKPSYPRLYEIQPDPYEKVLFKAIDDTTYSISYDELIKLTKRINNLDEVINKLNSQIRVYSDFIKKEQE